MKGYQHRWLAGGYDLEIGQFQRWLAWRLPGGYWLFCPVERPNSCVICVIHVQSCPVSIFRSTIEYQNMQIKISLLNYIILSPENKEDDEKLF